MKKLIFRETQSFRQTWVPWFVLLALVISLVMFAVSLYQSKSLPKETMNSEVNELFTSIIISCVLVGGVFLLLIYSKLTTEIWSDGIGFSFTPLLRRTRFIPISEIVTVEVQKYRPLMEFGGWGWRIKFMSHKTAYNVKGNIGLRIVKKDGSQVLLGTQQGEELAKAIATMKQNDAFKS